MRFRNYVIRIFIKGYIIFALVVIFSAIVTRNKTDELDPPESYWKNNDPERDASEIKTYDYDNRTIIWRDEDTSKVQAEFEFPEDDLDTKIEELIDKYED